MGNERSEAEQKVGTSGAGTLRDSGPANCADACCVEGREDFGGKERRGEETAAKEDRVRVARARRQAHPRPRHWRWLGMVIHICTSPYLEIHTSRL